MFKQDLLAGQRILVTGGGTGLGRAMTGKFLELGADAVICGRRGEVLAATAGALEEQYGRRVATYSIDIRQAAAVEEMVDDIFAHGGLTGLVNNAAGNFISRTEDLSSRGFDAVANIVMHGTFYVTQAVGKHWIGEVKAQGGWQPVGLRNRRLQFGRSGPFFTAFLSHSRAMGRRMWQKLSSPGPIFAFDAPSPTGC